MLIGLLGGALTAMPGGALGQATGTWAGPAMGSWSNPVNWTSDPLIPGGGGGAVFPANPWGPSTITLDAPASLSSIQLNGPTLYRLGGGQTIELVGGAEIHVEGPSAIQGGTLTGGLMSPLIVGHRINAPISGTAGLVKSGSGALLLGGTNSFSGPVVVNGGVLSFLTASAMSSPISNPLILNGGTVNGQLGEGRPIQVGASGGKLLTVGTLGPISGNGELHLVGNMIALGSLPPPYLLTGSSSFSGHLRVEAPVSLFAFSRLLHVGSITLAGEFSMGTALSSDDELSDTATITFRGGSLNVPNEAVGALIFASGPNRFSANSTTTIASMQRQGHATVRMSANMPLNGPPPALSGSGAADTPDVGVIRWASTGFRPMTFQAGVLRALNPTEYITSPPTPGVTTSNLVATGTISIDTPSAVNSLSLNTGTLAGAEQVTISSGMIVASSAVTLQAPIQFGAAEGIIHLTDGSLTSESVISGTNGLIIAGGSAIMRGASTYTGSTVISGAMVRLETDVIPGQAGPLGAGTSLVTIESGRVKLFDAGIQFAPGSSTLNFARDLSTATEGVTFFDTSPLAGSGARNVAIAGSIALNGPALFYQTGFSTHIELSGNITGPGSLYIYNDPSGGGTDRFTLRGNNTFTGGVQLGNGSLALGSDTALGTGPLLFDAGTVMAIDGARTLNNAVFIRSSFTSAGSHSLAFTGPVDLGGVTRMISLTFATSTTSFSGPVFNGSISKAGSGMLELSNARMPLLQVVAGPVRILANGTSTGTSRVNTLTLSGASSKLDLTDNDLVVDYTGVSPLPTIKSYLSNGRLFSSLAAPDETTLGYAENSLLGFTTFSGQFVDSTALLIKYTYFGDANLDGRVDARDLVRLANGWLAAGSWVNGDFDGDGMVNQSDLTLMARNWQAGEGAPLGAALDQLGLPSVEVPEPLAISLFTAISLLLRRNRRAFDSRIR